MIYHLTFSRLIESYQIPTYYSEYAAKQYSGHLGAKAARVAGCSIPMREWAATIIRESKDDSFCFILQNSQLPLFAEWMKKYDLEELEVFRSEAITNDIHTANGRNLTLVVLASKTHAWREMYGEDV